MKGQRRVGKLSPCQHLNKWCLQGLLRFSCTLAPWLIGKSLSQFVCFALVCSHGLALQEAPTSPTPTPFFPQEARGDRLSASQAPDAPPWRHRSRRAPGQGTSLGAEPPSDQAPAGSEGKGLQDGCRGMAGACRSLLGGSLVEEIVHNKHDQASGS